VLPAPHITHQQVATPGGNKQHYFSTAELKCTVHTHCPHATL